MMVRTITTITRKYLGVAAVALATTCAASSLVYAESDWPTGQVNMVMHTKAGGSADVFIRTLAKTLEPEIGKSIVVINAAGGGGANQMSRVRMARPDGLTLGINTLTHFTGMITNLKGTFSIDDFSWIASAQEDEIILYVRNDSKLNNMDDLINRARETGGTINIGGFGPIGSMQHLGISMLETAADIKLNWVAFEATPDITSALLGGHIDVGVSNLGALNAFFDAGRIKGLGVLGANRLTGLPDLPTFAEQGYDVDTSWVQVRGVFGPAGIPAETQQKIADAFHTAMKHEHYQAYARNAGVTDSWMGPEEYTNFVKNVTETAERQLKAAGLLE